MEKLRFEQSFKFNVLIDANADPSFVQVPPLILQPFLENAIWCGLLHKEGERNLKIEIKQDSDQIICIIDDNGIGREKAKQFNDQKTLERKSFGTELILDRLKVNRAMNKTNFAVQVIDKKIDGEPQGTRVELIFDI
jgi:sensor histidine kinase YesM